MKKPIILFFLLLWLIGGLNLNAQNPSLLPVPQNTTWGKDKFQLAGTKVLVSPDLFLREEKAISQFISFVKLRTGLSLSVTYNDDPCAQFIVLSSGQPGPAVPVINEKTGPQAREAYKLHVTAKKVEITAPFDAGIYYAMQTLRQLITGEENYCFIPEVNIEDYPAFVYRGVMMDFSHGGLLTEEEIKNQIDFLARWKMNQYYFYNEVSIEMKGYSLINYNACYSQEQIKRIIAYARERHMDVIPFVNFYSHLHEMLRIEKYSKLGIGQYGHDLDPRNPDVQKVLKDWIKQYADIFPSPFVHVGFDETWETVRLTIADPSLKPKELYLKQINFVSKSFQEYGKTVMLWTDITHTYPDIMDEFPKDLIPVIWEYSDNKVSFSNWLTPIRKYDKPFFVQSAVDNWGNVYLADKYTFDNIDLCLKTCRDEKAIGYITSVWTDAVQPLLRNTWMYMAYGSIGAWQKEAIDRSQFVDNYCQIMYPGVSGQISIGFKKMAEAEALLAKCLGRHTLIEMWADPFSSYHLANTKTHIEDYKNARIAAETAQESLFEALHSQTADTEFIKTLLFSSRLLEFTATRFVWGRTIVDRWNWVYNYKTNGKKDNLRFYDIDYATHGLTVDMMDNCTEIKEEYRKAWLSENMPYRLGTMLGRFDSEYLLWRNMYTRVVDYDMRKDITGSTLKFEDIFLNRKETK